MFVDVNGAFDSDSQGYAVGGSGIDAEIFSVDAEHETRIEGSLLQLCNFDPADRSVEVFDHRKYQVMGHRPRHCMICHSYHDGLSLGLSDDDGHSNIRSYGSDQDGVPFLRARHSPHLGWD